MYLKLSTYFVFLGDDDLHDTEMFSVTNEPITEEVDDFTCDICFRRFSSWWTLQRHRTVHSSDKMPNKTRSRNFKCDMCPRMFTDRWNLKQHLRIHTGEKPYACETCGRRFAKKYNMQSHMAIHLPGDI